MAGMRTVEELLKLGVADRFSITVFGAEPRGNYNRILLSPVLSGEQQADDIMLHRPNWYTRRGITLHSGDPIVEIDRKRRMVRSQNGTLASVRPADHRHRLRSHRAAAAGQGAARRRDVPRSRRRRTACSSARAPTGAPWSSAAVCSASKPRTASNLRGMHVTVVHLLDTLMERQLDAPAGALLKAALEKRGIEFRMSAKTEGNPRQRARHRREVRQRR